MTYPTLQFELPENPAHSYSEQIVKALANFESQEKIFQHPARFKIVPKGRRFGMTRGKANELMRRALGIPPPQFPNFPVIAHSARYLRPYQRALWVDVTYHNIAQYVQMYFMPVLKLLDKSAYRWHKSEDWLEIQNSIIDFRSADRPYNIEGFAYDDVFLNEAGIILHKEYLWTQAVRPMLFDYQSPALIAGTPKGKNMFHNLYLHALEYQKNNPNGLEYQAFVRTTFDNPFINVSEIESYIKSVDFMVAQQEVYGQFMDMQLNAFAYAFNPEKHVTTPQDAQYLNDFPLYLSFDFNVEPITCLLAQHGADWIRIIDEIRLMRSNIIELCDHIRAKYGEAHYYVTGDISGKNRNALVTEDTNFYTIIINQLQLKAYQLELVAHDTHRNSRVLVNALLERHPDFKIAPHCRFLIEDLRLVGVTPEGKINKSRNAYQSHLLDCLRYYLRTYHWGFIQNLE